MSHFRFHIPETDSQMQSTDWLWRGSGGKDWEFGVSRRKRLYIEWMTNRVPLGSIGNYIQCPAINHNRKEYEKLCMHMKICSCKDKGYSLNVKCVPDTILSALHWINSSKPKDFG